MSLFGPKAPCPHCGKTVPRHHDLGDFLCIHCGRPGPWATAEQTQTWDQEEERQLRIEQAQTVATTKYEQLLSQVAEGVAGPSTLTEVAELAPRTGHSDKELRDLSLQAWNAYATLAISDDVITSEEDDRLESMLPSLGLTWDEIERSFPDLTDALVIARLNGGILPEVNAPQLLTKKGETVHLECSAELMKEVTQREFRAGYQGFSFPIGKTGIRYRVGGARGHSVVTGTQMQVADEGILSVSSLRAVFIGARKTIELPYSKLVNLTVFTDGVRFHQSNRQTAPLFRIDDGEVVAATVNAAARLAP
jgi:uncharacterized Zn finger protein (UPF0148 family)